MSAQNDRIDRRMRRGTKPRRGPMPRRMTSAGARQGHHYVDRRRGLPRNAYEEEDEDGYLFDDLDANELSGEDFHSESTVDAMADEEAFFAAQEATYRGRDASSRRPRPSSATGGERFDSGVMYDHGTTNNNNNNNGHRASESSRRSRRSRKGTKRMPSDARADEGVDGYIYHEGDPTIGQAAAAGSGGDKSATAMSTIQDHGENMCETTMTVRIAGSLKDLEMAAGRDEYHMQRPMPVYIGAPNVMLSVDQTDRHTHKRLDATREGAGAVDPQKLKENPRSVIDEKDLVTKVVASGRNGFPVPLQLTFNNLAGAPDRMIYQHDSGRYDSSVSITLMPEQKVKNMVLLNTKLDASSIARMKNYPNATPKQLEEGTRKSLEENYLYAPHTAERPNIVIDDICRGFVYDTYFTDDERERANRKGKLPDYIVNPSADSAGYVKVRRDVWDRYLKKVIETMRERRPLSDVAVPHAHLTRVLPPSDFYKNGLTPAMRSMADDEVPNNPEYHRWSYLKDVVVPTGGRNGKNSEDAFLNKKHEAYVCLQLTHMPLDSIESPITQK